MMIDVASSVISWVRFPAARLPGPEASSAAIGALPQEAQATVPDADSAATTSLVPVEDTPYPNRSLALTVARVAVLGEPSATIAVLIPAAGLLDQDENLPAAADRLAKFRWPFPGRRYLKLLLRINAGVLQR